MNAPASAYGTPLSAAEIRHGADRGCLELSGLVLERLADLAAPQLRVASPYETPLSPAEIRHGIFHGLIS